VTEIGEYRGRNGLFFDFNKEGLERKSKLTLEPKLEKKELLKENAFFLKIGFSFN
jgi:hypothetical protein